MKTQNSEIVSIGKITINHYIKAFTIAFLTAFVGVIVTKYTYVFSPLLCADDQNYVSDIVFGLNMETSLHQIMLRTSVNFFGVIGARVFLILIVCASVSFVIALVYVKFKSKNLLFVPLISLVFPVSSTQFVFLNGSHPSWTLPFFACLFLCVELISRQSRTSMLCLITIVGLLFSYLLSFSSTMTTLVSLGFFVFIFDILRKEKLRYLSAFSLAVVAGFGPVFYIFKFFFFPTGRNHYTSYSGWLNTDAMEVFKQIFGVLTFISEMKYVVVAATLLFVVICILVVFNIKVIKWNFKSAIISPRKEVSLRPISFAVTFIVISILSIVPALVVVKTEVRYLELFFLFGNLGVLSGLIILTINGIESRYMAICLFCISIVFLILNRKLNVRSWEELHNQTVAIEEQLLTLKHEWPQNSQVVILGNSLRRFVGYNHWSTGLIRYLSGRPDLIGLVGTQEAAINDPFVEKWKKHGEEYWDTDANGRLFRKRMVGLERYRPTFSYQFNAAKGKLEPRDLIVLRDGFELVEAKHGGLFQPACSLVTFLNEFHSQLKYDSPPLVLGSLNHEKIPTIYGEEQEILTVFGNGKNIKPEPNPSGRVSGEFWLIPGQQTFGEKKFGDDYPPTPLLWREHFQLWQLDRNRWVLKSGNMSLRADTEDVYFRFEIWPNSARLFQLNNLVRLSFESKSANGDIIVGKGYLNRKWRGKVISRKNNRSTPEINIFQAHELTEL